MRFRVYRYNPETDSTPRMQDIVIEAKPGMMLRDALLEIKRLDESFAFRHSCGEGVCGSDAVNANGRNCLACITPLPELREPIEVRPLPGRPVIRDLVVDMAPLFDKWARAKGAFVPTVTRADDFARIEPASPARRAIDAAIECIGCGVCHASCDVVGWNPDYLGPAALNRAWTLVNDPRDGARNARLQAVAGDAGCHACHTHQSCTERCPKRIAPTASIAGLKRATAVAALRGDIA